MTYATRPKTTLYVGWPLNLPPLTARAAFDAQLETSPAPLAPEGCVIETAFGRLHIVGSCVMSPGDSFAALRQAHGYLHPKRRLRRIAVEVEVTPWSNSRCEIGIRPRDWFIPMSEGGRQRRYLALALVAAQELALRLETLINTWTHAQLVEVGAELGHLLDGEGPNPDSSSRFEGLTATGDREHSQ